MNASSSPIKHCSLSPSPRFKFTSKISPSKHTGGLDHHKQASLSPVKTSTQQSLHVHITKSPKHGWPSVIDLPRDIFLKPPTPAGAMALSALATPYRSQLQSAWTSFWDWSKATSCTFEPDVVNHYIATVCSQSSALSRASKFRASVTWVAAILSIDRPLDHLTWKLLRGLQKQYASEGKFWLDICDYSKFRAAKQDNNMLAIRLLCSTGLRPSELQALTPAAFKCASKPPTLVTRPTKHRPAGRSIQLSHEACDLAALLVKGKPTGQLIFPQTAAFVHSLQASLRAAITNDPSKLPLICLYSTRRLFATLLYEGGAQSPYIMAQMGHRSWTTTQIYIKHPSGAAPWRASFKLVLTFQAGEVAKFIPKEASKTPPMQEPSYLKKWLDDMVDPKKECIQDQDEDWDEFAEDGLL